MRSSRLLLASLIACTAACTALLGDFKVDPDADEATDGGGGTDTGSVDATTGVDTGTPVDAGKDAPFDAPLDAPVDSGPDGAPPLPDGGFLNLYTFGSTNTSPPSNMRVAYDQAGNLYILFAYSSGGGAPDGGTDVMGQVLTPVGSFDMGLVKIAPNGTKLWVRSFGSTGQEYPGGLAVDGNGDIYVSGASENVTSVNFGGAAGTLNKVAAVRYMGWILKLNANGDPLKAINIETNVPASNQGAACQSLVARGNRIVAMCNVYGDVTFPLVAGGTQTVTPPGTASGLGLVIAALDENLNAHWVNAFGSNWSDSGSSVALAGNNDVIFTANVFSATTATMFLDAKSSLSLSLDTLAPTAIIGRLGGGNGAGLWAKAYATDAANSVSFAGAGIDKADRVVVVGTVNGSVMLGGKPAVSAGSGDVLVATFAGDFGTPLDARSYGGTGYDIGSAVAVDRWDSVSVTGAYYSTGMAIGAKALPDPVGSTNSGFIYRAAPDLAPHWAGGFTTALSGTSLQAWSVAVDPSSGRVAAAGVFKGLINFGDSNPVRSIYDGGAYNVWVVERRP
jgi:hypothetical protein